MTAVDKQFVFTRSVRDLDRPRDESTSCIGILIRCCLDREIFWKQRTFFSFAQKTLTTIDEWSSSHPGSKDCHVCLRVACWGYTRGLKQECLLLLGFWAEIFVGSWSIKIYKKVIDLSWAVDDFLYAGSKDMHVFSWITCTETWEVYILSTEATLSLPLIWYFIGRLHNIVKLMGSLNSCV